MPLSYGPYDTKEENSCVLGVHCALSESGLKYKEQMSRRG